VAWRTARIATRRSVVTARGVQPVFQQRQVGVAEVALASVDIGHDGAQNPAKPGVNCSQTAT